MLVVAQVSSMNTRRLEIERRLTADKGAPLLG
jgi:hypothetical protein